MSSLQNPVDESTQTQQITDESNIQITTHDESQKASQESCKPHHHDREEEGGGTAAKSEAEEEGGRERLKRHRVEVAGRVWIPDMWGQEDLLKEWIDCAAFDASLVRSSILMARNSLAQQGRRAPRLIP